MKQLISLVLTGMIVFNGCTSWHSVNPYPDQTDKADLRLVFTSGRTMQVKEAYVEGDSLYAVDKRFEKDGLYEYTEFWDVPVAFALKDIAEAKQHGVSGLRTAALVFGIAAIGAVIAGGVALANTDYGVGGWGGG